MPEADLSAIRTIAVAQRPTKVSATEVAHPPPQGAATFAAFIESLPDVLVARDFRAVTTAIVDAHRAERAAIAMVGGHVVKTGLTPLFIDLMTRGVITHMAMNGSAADSRLRDGPVRRYLRGRRARFTRRDVRDGGGDRAGDE